MKSRSFFVVVMFVFTVASAQSAKAMYHTGIGRFMQRDPGQGMAVRIGGVASTLRASFIPKDDVPYIGSERPLANNYAGGMNLYQYASSDPVSRVDPDGLLDKRTEGHIAKLFSTMRPGAAKHIEKANEILKADCKVAKIIQSLRTIEEQDKIPDANTRARGLKSYHVWGLAYDVGIFKCPNGFKTADDCKEYLGDDVAAYKKIADAGKAQGFEWGGDWKTIKDYPHYQYPMNDFGYKNISELISDYEEDSNQRAKPLAPSEYVERRFGKKDKE
jgi:hypothetical protein